MKPKPKFTPHFLSLAAISVTLTAPSVHAGQIWDGGGTNNNWTSPANWDGNVTASTGLAVNFEGELRTAVNVSLNADTIINGINFTNDGTAGKTAGFSLTGNRLIQNNNIQTTAVTSSTITDTIGIDMILNGNRSITTRTNHNLTITGVISQDATTNRNLTKLGVATLTLSNTDNTFAGQFLSDAGTTQVTKLADNGTASSLGAGSSSIRLGSNNTATLEYIGTTDSSANKVFQIGTNVVDNTGNAAIVNNGTGKLTFTANNFNSNAGGAVTVARSLTLGGSYTGAANEITGVIQDHNTAGGGTVSLTKTGDSTWALSGASTYTGATNVTGGVLAVNGSLANTSTTIGTGSTLQGSGSIGGSVTVQDGGILAAGNSIESLATGALTLEALSTFAYEIDNDAAANVAGDLTAVYGNLIIDSGNTANLTLGELGSGSWTIGEKLTLISYSGTWNGGLLDYAGTLADDSTFTFSGMQWLFNYNDTVAGTNYTDDLTGSSFVTMTAIPEPSAALLGGLGLLALLRRRRN